MGLVQQKSNTLASDLLCLQFQQNHNTTSVAGLEIGRTGPFQFDAYFGNKKVKKRDNKICNTMLLATTHKIGGRVRANGG